MSRALPTARLGALLQELESLNRRVRELAGRSRIGDLRVCLERQRQVQDELARLRGEAPWPAELEGLVESVREEGRRTLVLVTSLRDELGDSIRDDRRRVRVAALYEAGARS